MLTLRTFLAVPVDSIDLSYGSDWYNEVQDAASWAAKNLAANYDYASDSTLDSHNAMVATINAFHQLVYQHDQTMSEEDALNTFLDTPLLHADLHMAIHHNCSHSVPTPVFITKYFPELLIADLDEKYEDFYY